MQYYLSHFCQYPKVSTYSWSRRCLVDIFFNSKTKAPTNRSFPALLPADVSCLSGAGLWTPQSRNDNTWGDTLPWWSLAPSHIWSRTIHCRLSRAGVVGGSCSGMVSEVCHAHILLSSVLICLPYRCDAKPSNLDAPGARRRTRRKRQFLIETFDPGILWTDFGLRSDITVSLVSILYNRSLEVSYFL